MLIYILLGWCLFLLVFYTGVWIEYVWYRHNLKRTFRAIYEAFTEDDEE